MADKRWRHVFGVNVASMSARPWLLPAGVDLPRAASAGVRRQCGTSRYRLVFGILSVEKMRVGTCDVEEVPHVLSRGEGKLGALHSNYNFLAGPAPQAPGQPAAPPAAQALPGGPPAQPASCRVACHMLRRGRAGRLRRTRRRSR